MGWISIFDIIGLLIGLLLGFLSGLGIGGGSLLILWLTLACNMPQPEAQIINLLFFITAAGAITIFRWKKGTLILKKVLPAIILGCLFSGLFSIFSKSWNMDILKKVFGGMLLIIGVKELLYRPRNAR